MTTIKWEEEHQRGDELPEVYDTDGIHKDGNNDSYMGSLVLKFNFRMVQETHGSEK